MNIESQFPRHASGALQACLAPSVVTTAWPSLATMLVLILGSSFLADRISVALLVTGVILASGYFVCRFGLPATEGNVYAGWNARQRDGASAFQCLLYFLFLSIFWAVPVGALSLLAAGDVLGVLFGTRPAVGLSAIAAAITLALLLLAPVLSVIVSLRARRIDDLVSLSILSGLFRHRTNDLVFLFAALPGGMGVFWFLYSFPILALVTFLMPGGVPGIVFLAINALPLAMAPVLLGRLCGAYVHAGSLSARAGVEPARPAANTPTTKEATRAPRTVGPAWKDVISAVNAVGDEKLDSSIKSARIRIGKDPDDLKTACQLALLIARTRRSEETRLFTESAIRRCVSAGAVELAANLYLHYGNRRKDLQLDAACKRQLVNGLVRLQRFPDAAWCLYSAVTEEEGRPVDVQNGLIRIAGEAGKAGKHAEAAVIYDFFLKHFPKSDMTEEVQAAIERETQLQKTQHSAARRV